jgi:hypothetical protein
MRLFRDERGNVTIIVCLILTTLLGVTALVVDMGVVYAEKVQLANAIDAALLAGGQELPDDKTKAKTVMEQYLIANGVLLDEVVISIDYDGKGASIEAVRNVEFSFARVLGLTDTDVYEYGALELGTASSASGGLRPYALEKFDFTFGDPVILKEGAGDGYHGNYGTVALGYTGAADLLENALYGYDGVIKIGDWISTEPGNKASVVNEIKNYIDGVTDTFDNHENDSDRLWTIPMVDTLIVDGRDEVQVVGFAQIYITEVKKVGGAAEVYAKFVQFVTSGDIDNTIEDTGVYGMKLVN